MPAGQVYKTLDGLGTSTGFGFKPKLFVKCCKVLQIKRSI